MKKEFQKKESSLVYETLDIHMLDQKIVSRKMGLVAVCVCVCVHHLLFMLLRTSTIFVKKYQKEDSFKNTILTSI